MNSFWKLTVLSITLGCSWATALDAADDAAPKTVKLLTVGNSFSNNATSLLAQLAKADGNVLVHRACSVGGATLELHWGKVEQFERDPQAAGGLYASKKGLKQELESDQWEFVTIQQASIRSHDVNTYRPYAKQLCEYIQHHAPQAKVLMHETWAYRMDDPRFSVKSPKPGEPATQQAMYEGLNNAYQTIASELKIGRIPSGDALYLADTDPNWGYRPDAAFNFKTAQFPQVPKQEHSLHVGWRWVKEKDGKSALRMDGHHANKEGCYLAGCVFYETLFGTSPIGNKFVPPGVDPEYVLFLQTTAHRAVEQLKKAAPAPATN